MADYKGKFVWYELMTSDMKAAEAFYASVVGWTAKDAGMPGMAYTLFSAGAAQVAGMMAIPEEARKMGMPPNWGGYLAVPDVDAAAAAVKKAGGTIHREPMDIPGVGRFAPASDPQGAMFSLFRGTSEAPAADAATPGNGSWAELHSSDPEAGFAFYAGLVGWTKMDAFDMGPAGPYQTFGRGGEMIGGAMRKEPQAPMSFWLYYFNVPAIDAALGRVTAGGGKVLNGPMEVPGGSWVAQCMDPQGAMFALTAAKR
jgi:predicted enzyme related to lactoylglutathione lyase